MKKDIMLQNRVDPWGNIIKTPARGAWTGNRGVLHNDRQELLRPYKIKTWITCKLEFKGRKRQVMAPNRWTELFFLDEATSFSAGHRPCFECRREDARKFKSLWLRANPEYNFSEETPIREIDEVLHKERMDRHRSKITFEEKTGNIPNGSFILLENKPYLVADGMLFLWSPFGYERGMAFPEVETLPVLTPKSVVNAFRAGYRPQMAITATAAEQHPSNHKKT